MTITYTDVSEQITTVDGVYAPQEDSQLLVDVMQKLDLARGGRVLDLCTGSGVVAINAALQGAASVTAFDICPKAVACATSNAIAADVDVDVHLGSWEAAKNLGQFDLVVCNPPYVPHNSAAGAEHISATIGAPRAWNAGHDGRMVLDPLCAAAPDLLADGGSMLIVHSEFSGPRQTLAELAAVGMDADIVVYQWIPFGPVLDARAAWLEDAGLLDAGRREEELVVIRADKP